MVKIRFNAVAAGSLEKKWATVWLEKNSVGKCTERINLCKYVIEGRRSWSVTPL